MDLIGKIQQYNSVRRALQRKYANGGSFQLGGRIIPEVGYGMLAAYQKSRNEAMGDPFDFEQFAKTVKGYDKGERRKLLQLAQEAGVAPDPTVTVPTLRTRLISQIQKALSKGEIDSNVGKQLLTQVENTYGTTDEDVNSLVDIDRNLSDQEYLRSLQNNPNQGGTSQSATRRNEPAFERSYSNPNISYRMGGSYTMHQKGNTVPNYGPVYDILDDYYITEGVKDYNKATNKPAPQGSLPPAFKYGYADYPNYAEKAALKEGYSPEHYAESLQYNNPFFVPHNMSLAEDFKKQFNDPSIAQYLTPEEKELIRNVDNGANYTNLLRVRDLVLKRKSEQEWDQKYSPDKGGKIRKTSNRIKVQ